MTYSKYSEIYERFLQHYNDLTDYMSSKVSTRDEAEEIVQDTFLRLMKDENPTRFNKPRSFLFRTAINIWIDRLRRKNVRSKYIVDVEEVEEICDRRPTPYDALVDNELQAALEKAILSLSSRRRRVFILHRYKNYSHARIASELGISRSAVEKHIARALADCRKALSRLRDR